MQHDQSKITGLRKTERTRNARTPDRSDLRHMDISMKNAFSPKRKVHTSRMSMMPPPSLNTTNVNLRKLELENNNLELELAYSEYLSSYTELILEKKTLKAMEVSHSNAIKSLHEETKSLQEKCGLIQLRMNDIKILSCLDDYVDVLKSSQKNFIDLLEKYEIKNILLKLNEFLNRFNMLPCENIILPNTAEELQAFMNTLKECSTILQRFDDPIQCDIVEGIATNYEEFITKYQEISSLKKIIEEKICNLQTEVLKTCSCVLSQPEVSFVNSLNI